MIFFFRPVFHYHVVGTAVSFAACRNGWNKCILFTISSVLGYLGRESKTASHLCLGLWPALKFCTCVANIIPAKQLAEH